MVALRWAELGAAADSAASTVPAVARVVVIGTSLGQLSAPWRRMRPGMLPTLARTALARDPRRREALVLDLTSTVAGARREAVLDEREPVARARPMPRGVALRQLVAAGTERGPRPGSVRTPMLVIAGARDRLVDPRCSRAVARAFGAELAEHPTAGHDVPLDDPDWLLDQLGGAVIPA
jgi:pimeloyl-ACP methyl ester carboxylesterase